MSAFDSAPHRPEPPSAHSDLVYATALCAVFLLCVVLAHPFAPAAFNDDWSYAFVAYSLQKAGHLQYSGWGSPMVLFQSLWGALWAHIFGFSFDVLRLATLPFSCGFVVGVYALGRKAGLAPAWAAFGAATVTLSPLFLPLAASFMTEPYSGFFTVVCLYSALSALNASSRRTALVWLYLLLVAGVLGGSSRQTVWTAALSLIPYLAYRKRSDRAFLAHAGLAFAGCIAALLYCSLHFTQPYAAFQLSRQDVVHAVVHRAFWGCLSLLMLFITTLLLAWPALLSTLAAWAKLSRRFLALAAAASAIVAFVLLIRMGDGGVIPFIGNIFSPYGVLNVGQEGLGFRPKLLQNRFMVLLSAALFFSAIATLASIRKSRIQLPRNVRDVFLVSAAAYLPLLVPGAVLGFMYDRYTLPLLPLVVIWILFHAQAEQRRSSAIAAAWRPAWICAALLLVVFAAYGTAVTHDYYAALRARAAVVANAEAHGIPQNAISAGFENDGWTQLQAAGRLKGVAYRDSVIWNTTTVFWFWKYTTALHPDYLAITKIGSLGAGSKALAKAPYRTWLAPHQRYAGIWKASDVPKTQVCTVNSNCADMDHPIASANHPETLPRELTPRDKLEAK